jgi:surfeit locus 1 family protein
MLKRMIAPLLFGLVGAGILLSLGVWQVQRMAWKAAELAEIDARIMAEPVALPEAPQEVPDQYLPVTMSGRVLPDEIVILASLRQAGPVYRIIRAFESEAGRRVMVDLGFVHPTALDRARPGAMVRITGNLHWPDEIDGFTPAPDLEAGLWFGRDVEAMAAALDTEPVLIVARDLPEALPWVTVFPVDSANIPNDHLAYAVTWFLLAIAWLGMTGFLLLRISKRTI